MFHPAFSTGRKFENEIPGSSQVAQHSISEFSNFQISELVSFFKYNTPSILWAVFILALCLMPGRELPSLTIWEFDKIGHFGVYLILSVLMVYGWRKQKSFSFLHSKVLLKILLLTSVYGFAVEVMQELFTTDRHFDILDALANACGAVAGSFFSSIFIKKKA